MDSRASLAVGGRKTGSRENLFAGILARAKEGSGLAAASTTEFDAGLLERLVRAVPHDDTLDKMLRFAGLEPGGTRLARVRTLLRAASEVEPARTARKRVAKEEAAAHAQAAEAEEERVAEHLALGEGKDHNLDLLARAVSVARHLRLADAHIMRTVRAALHTIIVTALDPSYQGLGFRQQGSIICGIFHLLRCFLPNIEDSRVLTVIS